MCTGRVLREIADNVWAADRPFLWNGIDVGGPASPLPIELFYLAEVVIG